ncbi:porin [Sediminibacterium sp.]|uniref:porin n=1 Tax=Sediminibacterium sp. TaxID=1917865 RepID=UPI0025E08C2E|nr:porin [Sediminibacterium sp.]MBW0177107.1 OprO/OprP family phosphate-selective porin [Sediminibacterium sp.]
MARLWIAALLVMLSFTVLSQTSKDSTKTAAKPAPEKKWFETFSVRGYVQARYNRLLETNPNLGNEQGDRSWGKNGGFFLRRTRIIFFGQISKQVYFYIQPDFASSASSSSLHFGQLRDAYMDVGVDAKNEFRFRIGQSKVPYGFENMQSSQNRLVLDRNDALNSAVANERDLGVFFYWAPTKQRELFSSLVRDGLKGSGDYGVFAFGAYNGQTANKPEQNDQLHVVTRFSYPMAIGKQIIEPGIQAYTGKYVVTREQTSSNTKIKQDRNYLDQRVAGTFVLYPKPFGIQAEYTFGKGPEFNTVTDSIETRSLQGGYITLSYLIKNKQQQIFIPFVRGQYYDGGKKHELDARSYRVKELEIGIEWIPVKQFELVAMYTISSRRYEDFALQNNLQKGNLLRLQAQFNF